MDRITPRLITRLEPGDLYVYGSNLQGIDGAGAALAAAGFGRRRGKGDGLYINTYAIPTRNYLGIKKLSRGVQHQFENLSLDQIQCSVNTFLRAIEIELFEFKRIFVTPIGCGYAGYDPHDIAPFFADAVSHSRIWLPEIFLTCLLKKKF